jgi:hypothetical protein
MIHHPEHVIQIRARAEVCAKAVADLEARVKDPYIRGQLKFVRNSLGDIESVFLQSLTRESRTPAQEAKLLAHAEMVLQIAQEMLKIIQEIVAKYGSDVSSVA